MSGAGVSSHAAALQRHAARARGRRSEARDWDAAWPSRRKRPGTAEAAAGASPSVCLDGPGDDEDPVHHRPGVLDRDRVDVPAEAGGIDEDASEESVFRRRKADRRTGAVQLRAVGADSGRKLLGLRRRVRRLPSGAPAG
jgi:hypothetical protein